MRERRPVFLFAAALGLLVAMPALPAQQPPALAPTSNTTIATSGPLHYSSILIPAGVTVQFTGPAPAVVRCDGDCIVHGTLSAAATGATSGPGWVPVGMGWQGSICFGGPCGAFGCTCPPQSTPAGLGVHYGAYGTAVPFDLQGGSPGGTTIFYDSSNWLGPGCCDIVVNSVAGGGGGGTLVVLAGGRIEIDGTVDVRGGSVISFGGPATGSAGSLLLRGGGGTALLPGGQVLAGGQAPANGGIVRLDAWGAPPDVQGIVSAPAPTLLELPHLRAAAPPQVGTTWALDVFAPDGSLVILAASPRAGLGIPTPFGTLEVHIASSANVAFTMSSTAPSNGLHDPRAAVPWAIPSNAALLGLSVWLQALVVPPTLAPRLSNGIVATVQ